jgi:hypothetical protein
VKDQSSIDTSSANQSNVPGGSKERVDEGTLVSGLVRVQAYKVAKDFIDCVQKRKEKCLAKRNWRYKKR